MRPQHPRRSTFQRTIDRQTRARRELMRRRAHEALRDLVDGALDHPGSRAHGNAQPARPGIRPEIRTGWLSVLLAWWRRVGNR